MPHAVATLYDDNYRDLAELTNEPKIEYCERYGYKFFELTEMKYSKITGFNKIHYTLELFKLHPDIDWLLFCECDAMITNLTIPIDEKADNDYHVVVPVDRLNLNTGNFLVRNTEQGRAYLQMIIDKEPDYILVEWAEQQVVIDTIDEYQDIVKIVPQKYMNSYEPQIYDYCDASKDIMGNSGAWEQGDWIVHWPGTYKNVRLKRAERVGRQIIR